MHKIIFYFFTFILKIFSNLHMAIVRLDGKMILYLLNKVPLKLLFECVTGYDTKLILISRASANFRWF